MKGPGKGRSPAQALLELRIRLTGDPHADLSLVLPGAAIFLGITKNKVKPIGAGLLHWGEDPHPGFLQQLGRWGQAPVLPR